MSAGASSGPPVPSGPILYVLKRFPRLSETFVLREMLTLESLGERILIDSLLPPEEGQRHPDLARLRASVRYVPKHPRLRDGHVLRRHLHLATRAPRLWSRLALRARRRGGWRRFLQAGLVAERARQEGVRHIHAHFLTAAGEVARDASMLTGIPASVTAHAKDIFQADNVPLVRWRAKGVTTLVTVSEYNARYLHGLIGNGPPVHTVPNGVELAPPMPDRPDGPVLCVARLVPKKGVDVLIRAAAQIHARTPDLRVEIIGGGPLRGDLERQAHRLGIGDRVVFRGPQPWGEVESAFGRCSVIVMACRVAKDGDRDGMPTVLTEALARGLPVISTDVAGIPELVRDHETGLLVPPEDPAALADAIEMLLRDRELARRLGLAGRDLVAERFDPGQSAALLRAAFEGAAA